MGKNLKILFVCYGGGHSAIIDTLASYLVTYNINVNFKILALTMGYNFLIKKYPNNVVCLSDYEKIFSEREIIKAQKYGKLLLKDNHRKDGLITEKESILYLGLSMLDLIEKYGQDIAKKKYQEKKRKAFIPTTIIKKILAFETPEAVCTTNSPRFEKAALLAAKELKIRNYEIIDLLGDGNYVTADNVIVMNESVKKTLKKNNATVNNINYFCLGQPVIEKTINEVREIDKFYVEKKLNISSKKNINIVFFSQPILFSRAALLDKYRLELLKLFVGISKLPNVNFFIRIHPNETEKDYLLFENTDISFIRDKLSLSETLALSNIVITFSSTVAVESVYSGKTTCLFHHDLEGIYPFESFTKKPFIFSRNLKELQDKLYYLINSLPKNKTTNQQTYPVNAAKNIVNLLLTGNKGEQ